MPARLGGRALWWLALVACTGCGGRDQLLPGGSLGSLAGAGAGAAAGDGTGGSASQRGLVWLSHGTARQFGDSEHLELHAAFYGSPYDLDATGPLPVDTLTTPDGVPCDIHSESGPAGDELPPPPAEIDAGPIVAWSGVDPSEVLAIDFDGEHYGYDSLDSPQDMPAWLGPGAAAFQVQGDGAHGVDSFLIAAELPAAPTITTPPSSDMPLPPGPDGTFLVAWRSGPADETLVWLFATLEGDTSTFICHPPASVTELRLPADWIRTWTWGDGVLGVSCRNRVDAAVTNTAISVHALRGEQQPITFATSR